MNEKSDQIPCPMCEKMVFKRGLFGHLILGHGKTPKEAHEVLSSPNVEKLKEEEPVKIEQVEKEPGERRRLNWFPPFSFLDRRKDR